MTVEAAELRRLVDVPVDKTDDDLSPFLTAAALIRSEDLTGSGLSSGRLDQIELYLAAHFTVIALENGGIVESKQGESSERYKTPRSELTGLSSTRFGQTALALDTSNTLQSTMSTNKAQFTVIRGRQPPRILDGTCE